LNNGSNPISHKETDCLPSTFPDSSVGERPSNKREVVGSTPTLGIAWTSEVRGLPLWDESRLFMACCRRTVGVPLPGVEEGRDKRDPGRCRVSATGVMVTSFPSKEWPRIRFPGGAPSPIVYRSGCRLYTAKRAVQFCLGLESRIAQLARAHDC
jgi:hypothetical protein